MSKIVGFGILGAGMIAEYHAQAVLENAPDGAHLVALGHYNPSRFSEIERHYGVPCLSETQLLHHPEIDVICICTPSGQHAAQAIAAAKAGKHVLVEKPMATSLADADAMIAACSEHKVHLGVAFQSRAKPVFQEIHAAIQAGVFGDLTLGLVSLPYYRPQSYYNQAAWRGTWSLDGGGVLMNQGIHQVDLLLWFLGDPIEVIGYAHTSKRQIEVEDTLCASLRFANGALGVIAATTTTEPGFAPRMEIYGTLGGLQVEGDMVTHSSFASGKNHSFSPPSHTPTAGAGADPRGIATDWHTALVKDFLVSIRSARQPLVDGKDGRRSLATVLAIYQAAGIRVEKTGEI